MRLAQPPSRRANHGIVDMFDAITHPTEALTILSFRAAGRELVAVDYVERMIGLCSAARSVFHDQIMLWPSSVAGMVGDARKADCRDTPTGTKEPGHP